MQDFPVLQSKWRWLPVAAITLLCCLVYARFLTNGPLLDEQYLTSWARAAGTKAESLSAFIGYGGFASVDLWGPVATTLLKATSVFQTTPLFRLQGVLLHAIGAWLVCQVVVHLTERKVWALVCACLFVIHPITPPAVLWLGGRASELATILLLCSFYAYLQIAVNWRWLIAAALLYILALLSSAAIWPFCLLYGIYEVVAHRVGRQRNTGDNTLKVVAPLGFFVITAAYFAGRGVLSDLTTLPAFAVRMHELWVCLRSFIIPAKVATASHAVSRLGFLAWILAPAAVLFFRAACGDRRLQVLAGFGLVWLILAVMPVCGFAGGQPSGFGRHLLYSAAPGVACILTALIFSFADVCRSKPAIGWALVTVSFVTVSISFIAQSLCQNGAYRFAGQRVAAVQRAIALHHEDSAHIIVCDLPGNLALIPAYTESPTMVFDASTGLVSANVVSAGRLKDLLVPSAGIPAVHDRVFRWRGSTSQLEPLDLHQTGSSSPTLDAAAIAARLMPPLANYPAYWLDSDKNELVLKATGAGGPVIRISAEGFSPTGLDFLFVDAEISSFGKSDESSGRRIELYWTTEEQPYYDHAHKRSWVPISYEGSGYHRYYLSLRNMGWLAAGQTQYLTLGFPQNSQVRLKAIGGTSASGLIPQFQVLPPSSHSSNRYDPPFFNFPNDPALGFCRYPPWSQDVSVFHSCKSIPAAAGAMIEISMPNKFFSNTNGLQASGVGAAILGAPGVSGHNSVPLSNFPSAALYSMRAAAQDRGHNAISRFSDDAFVLITRPNGSFSVQ